MSRPGLYVHVPFCAGICHYCHFNRGLLDPELKRRYVAALERDIRETAADLTCGRHPADRSSWPGGSAVVPAPDSLYFGGGTPSVMEPSEVARIVSACRAGFGLGPDAEITLEANPETLTAERVAAFHDAGVNRISLGVQSFSDRELRRLGRRHTAEQAEEALAWVRAADLVNVSLDLMLGLPAQSLEDWEMSLDRLLALRPAHASLYLLELHASTRLRDEVERGTWSLPPDEIASAMYERGTDRLEAAGYEHYEISNFALPGRRSRHNLKYWSDGEWLAFGCGAHATLAGVRWTTVASAEDYVARVEQGAPRVVGIRRLTPAERLEEALFMRLRLREGIDLGEMSRHHAVDVWERYGDQLRDVLDAGLVTRDGGRLRLTRRGLLLSNEVMAVFIDAAVR